MSQPLHDYDCDVMSHIWMSRVMHTNPVGSHIRIKCSSLRWSVKTQQHTATHCNTLQHTATHCNARWSVEITWMGCRDQEKWTLRCSASRRLAYHSWTCRSTSGACRNMPYFVSQHDTSMWLYVCVYIYTYKSIHMHKYISMHMCVYVSPWICVYTYVYVYVYI